MWPGGTVRRDVTCETGTLRNRAPITGPARGKRRLRARFSNKSIQLRVDGVHARIGVPVRNDSRAKTIEKEVHFRHDTHTHMDTLKRLIETTVFACFPAIIARLLLVPIAL